MRVTQFQGGKKMKSRIMDRYNNAINNYEELFGDSNDIYKYVSTWDYDEEDFKKLAQKIETCIYKKKRYTKLYVSIIEKVYLKTLYKLLAPTNKQVLLL